MGGFPGAVGAAVQRHEEVDRRRGRRALDAPVGQVELGVDQRQEGEVGDPLAIPPGGGDDAGRGRAAAAHQPRVEAGDALGIRDRRSQHRVPARNELHLDPRARGGVPQAAHGHGQPVAALPCREPEVRDHEPLRGAGAAVGGLPRHGGVQHVDAGIERQPRLPQVDAGCDLLVHRPGAAAHGCGHVHLALPDLGAQAILEAARLPVVQRRGEQVLAQRLHDVAVGHAVKRQVHAVRVHRGQRQPLVARRGQHIGPPGKAGERRAVADILRLLDRAAQRLALVRGQARAQGKAQHLAARGAGDAKVIALGLDRQRGVGKLDKGTQVDLARQGLREAGADARFRPVRVGAAAGHAEAVALLIALALGGEIRVSGLGPGGGADRAQGLAAAPFLLGQPRPEPQHPRARARIAQPGVQRGQRGGPAQLVVALAALRACRLVHGGGERGPVPGRVRQGGGRPQPADAGLGIGGRSRLRPQPRRVAAVTGIKRRKPRRLVRKLPPVLGADPVGLGQPLGRPVQHGRVARHHHARLRAREGLGVARLRLEETGAGTGVPGQRRAAVIGKAGLHAGVLPDLADHGQVVARQVGVGSQHDAGRGHHILRRNLRPGGPGHHRKPQRRRSPKPAPVLHSRHDRPPCAAVSAGPRCHSSGRADSHAVAQGVPRAGRLPRRGPGQPRRKTEPKKPSMRLCLASNRVIRPRGGQDRRSTAARRTRRASRSTRNWMSSISSPRRR